ncbi:MAG: 50S ribosomal protein L32 [Candidatus Mycalebacterium zealandia]|nr:MAG: 50S ribosomal protein L32 [Candidatus Mycalebacterium zealandia]
MAVPKRKTSTSKSRKRRTHYKAQTPASSMCPQCNEKMPPHRACPHCGYYKGRTFMKSEDEETEQ